MFLHNDEELFKDVIIAASVDQKRPVAIVEKDYYVTMLLRLLAQKIRKIVSAVQQFVNKLNSMD